MHHIRRVAALLCLSNLLPGQVTWSKVHNLGNRIGSVMTTLGPQGGVLLCCGSMPFETWRWDGMTKTWTMLTPSNSPVSTSASAPLFDSAIAYDASRDRVVLQGGSHAAWSGQSNLTWEWDGVTWSQALPTTAGPALANTAAAYDNASQRMLVRAGNETWTWDGIDWAMTQAPGPAAAREYAIAYDSSRQRTVLFGGRNSNNTLLAETWEWDGSAWLLRTPAVSPSARNHAAAAYDAARRRVVLFGGSGPGGPLNDTWEWDGTNWQQVLPTSPPPPGIPTMWFYRPALAFDHASSRCVLRLMTVDNVGSSTWEFDGVDWILAHGPTCPPWNAPLAFDPVNHRVTAVDWNRMEIWSWDGTHWAVAPAAATPPPRRHGATGFDAARGRLVLFGGVTGSPPNSTDLGDTWEWDGSTWLQRSPATSPPARSFAEMAWDPTHQRLILLGGGSGTTRLFDMWSWDGNNWTQHASWPGSQQSFSGFWGIAHDATRDRLVVPVHYYTTPWSTQTWEWDGQSWQLMLPASALCAGSGGNHHRLVYDSARGRCVSIGFCNASVEWDGVTWTDRTPVEPLPYTIRECAAAFDPDKGEIVIWGGVLGPMENFDVWTYGPVHPASHEPFGGGCPGTAGTPLLAIEPGDLPWLGETILRQVTSIPNGAPASLLLGLQATQWGGIPLPLALSSVGATGCELLVSPEVGVAMVATNSTATTSFQIPNLPAVLGVRLYEQAAVLDAAANPFGATFSNGGTMAIGGR